MNAPHLNNVSRMIQGFFRIEGFLERLRRDPKTVYREFGVSAEEEIALAEGTPEAMARIGVHPILQVHWMMAMNPQMGELINMQTFTQRLGEK